MNKKLNQISLISLLATFPLFINCTITHYCMCGHNAHGQLSDNVFQYLNDVIIFLLFAISLGLSLYDKRYKLSYYLSVLFTVVLVQLFSFMGLIFYPLILILHMRYHNGRKIELKEEKK